MLCVVTGDIAGSRLIDNQDRWIKPLKKLFKSWGLSTKEWAIYRGDSFQFVVTRPQNALNYCIQIKALLTSISAKDVRKRVSKLDVRLAIGIGESGYQASKVTESNGQAYIFSGELLEHIKEKKITMAIKTPWPAFDNDMNLFLRLALIAMDNWTINSGKLIHTIWGNKSLTQEEIGKILKIRQNTVSGRYKRAYVDEILALERTYASKINQLLS